MERILSGSKPRLLSACWLAFVLCWCGVSEAQTDTSRCQYMVDNSSTVYGVCQKVVTAPSSVRACYWFQSELHSESSIPYVGDMQVVPTSDGLARGVQGYTAVCSFSRKLDDDFITGRVDPSFRVIFSPDFAAQYDAGRLLIRTDAETATPSARKLEQVPVAQVPKSSRTLRSSSSRRLEVPRRRLKSADSAAGTADESSPFSNPVVLAVVGCVAILAVALIAVNVVIVVRHKRKERAASEGQPQDPMQQLSPCAIALRHTNYPNNIFGITNTAFNNVDTTSTATATAATAEPIPRDTQPTTSNAGRSAAASSSAKSAVRFENREPRGTQLPVPRVHSLAAGDAGPSVAADKAGLGEEAAPRSLATGFQLQGVAASGSHCEDDQNFTKTESEVLY